MTWASQRRRIITGEPSIAGVLGRLKEQGPGAGSFGKLTQRWEEVYSGDGLIVQRVLVRISETPRLVLSLYYLLQGPWFTPARLQAESIGISRAEYWTELEKGEEAVALGLRLVTESRLDISSAEKTLISALTAA